MPWRETHVRDQRLAFVAAAMRPEANRRALCREFGVSPQTGYKWLTRTRAEGLLNGVTDRSRRPHHSPDRTPAAVEAQIVALRREYGWAGQKLQRLLRDRGIACGAATIDRIIRRHGLTDPDEQHRPAPQRFARATPNALWQMDFKGQYPVRSGWLWPLSVVDDATRYAVGLAAMPQPTGRLVQAQLVRVFERYGVPEAILCDHGVPWWNAMSGHGLTHLSVFLLEQDIQLLHGAVAHPQTQGKVERFHRTLGRRLRQWGVPTTSAAFARALARFEHEYNHVRPHAALALDVPAAHYQPSPRAFVPEPRAWTYPAPALIRRVDCNGAIHYDRRAYFVCHALATRDVGCQQIGDRVLVRFRQTYVRELDLTTGRTLPVLRSVRTDPSTMS